MIGRFRRHIEKRVLMIADYIASTGDTIRNTARNYGVSKTTVHVDVTERLYKINKEKYFEVQKVLQENKAARHIRGGEATRNRYKKIKKMGVEAYKNHINSTSKNN